MQDGLPDQTIQALAQTPDGYLWIGTKGGLLRFNGSQFVIFDHANTPGLGESSVNCLLADDDGSVWIGTEGGGLYRYKAGVFRAVPMPDGRSDSFVRVLFKDSRGLVWVGGDQGLFQVAGHHLERVDGVRGIPATFVRAIAEDPRGNLWVGGTLLLRLSPSGAVRQIPFPGGPNHNLVTAIVSRGTKLWFGTLSGIRVLDTLGPMSRLKIVGNPDWTIQTLRSSSDGAVWIGTLGDGVARYAHGRLERAVAPAALPSNSVLAIFEDRERDMWLGMQGGLERLAASPVTILPFPGAEDAQFETISGDSDGSVWCAATHLFHIHGDRVERASIPGLPRGARVRTLLRDRAGALWAGTNGEGLFRIARGQVKQYAVRNGMSNNFPRVLLQARDGSMWVGTDGGVDHIMATGIRGYNTPQGLAYFSVTALLEDRGGEVWIGTSRGLSILRSDHFLSNPATEALSREKIWSLYQDEQGAIWISTSDGLYRFAHRGLTHYSTAEGLPENVIYQVIGDASNYLWLSSPDGVARVSGRALVDEQGGDQHAPLSVTFYATAQDFGSAILYGGMQPAGFLDAHGDAWFPSNKGAVRIHAPRTAHDDAPPFPVVIDSILVDGQPRPLSGSLKLAAGTARLEVGFAAILLRSQQGLRYRYRLQGFDHGWNDASASRTASYTNLHPGRYRLEVQAYEAGNPSVFSAAALTLVQQPHFYKTEWFALICISSLLLAFAAAHRVRVRQVGIRFHAVLQERNRLAREMHDTLIQDCVGVSTLLEAISKLDFEDKALCHELIDHARQQVCMTIDETRSAVWDLRHSSLRGESGSIQGAVEELARQQGNHSGVPVHCTVSGHAYALPGHAAHAVVMIVKEALANAARHAYAARVDVRLQFAEDGMSVRIEDDGIGFDGSQYAMELDPIHYGVRGMQERAERIGGKFSLESRPGAGTVICVRLPRRMRSEAAAASWRAS